MTNNPLITVYIPSRNYGRFLKKAVGSVLSQLYENWELFIFDEDSDDDTLNVARGFERRLPKKITVITSNKPQGLQKIANSVLQKAAGKYLIRLDADDWLDDSALLVMAAKLESDRRLGLVYPNYFYTDEGGKIIGMERRLRLWEEDNSGHFPPHGACTMVRTRSLKAVGGYSEDISAQDGWELWYKLRDRVKSASIDLPLFFYRQHGGSLSRDHERLLKARAKIFVKIARNLKGDYSPTVLAVIPVRESFPNFPDVPFQIFGEDSLLKMAIDSVSHCEQVTEVMVASSSQKVLDFSYELEESGSVGAHTRLLRLDDLSASLDVKTTMSCAAHEFFDNHGYFPDIVVMANLHAVGRTSGHVDKAINMLRITESDSVVSVQEEREPIFKQGKGGMELLNPGRFDGLSLSKDREKIFRFNGSVIAAWWEIIELDEILGGSISSVEMSCEESVQVKTLKELQNLTK